MNSQRSSSGIMKNLIAPKAWHMGIFGAIGGSCGNLITEAFLPHEQKMTLVKTIIKVGFWFGVIGAFISAALWITQSYYLKQRHPIFPSLKRAAPFGFMAGLAAGAFAQFLYWIIGPTEVLRVICWGIAGGFLGYVLSFRIPNLGKINGFLGGIVGGAIGGILFIILGWLFGPLVGRTTGTAAIGFCIGLMLVIVESLARKIWLEIIYGPRESINVNLGKEPVRLGSNPSLCTVYVNDVPPVALEYGVDKNSVYCKNVTSGEVAKVQPGERKRLGNVEIVVCSADHPKPKLSAPPPSDHGEWWRESSLDR